MLWISVWTALHAAHIATESGSIPAAFKPTIHTSFATTNFGPFISTRNETDAHAEFSAIQHSIDTTRFSPQQQAITAAIKSANFIALFESAKHSTIGETHITTRRKSFKIALFASKWHALNPTFQHTQ
jgi:hypothetical protein